MCGVKKNVVFISLSLDLEYVEESECSECLQESKSTFPSFIQKNPTRCNSVSRFIIPYLYEAQHVSGDTPPFIRSLKLH
jgi:hypothetical protein